MLTFAEDEMSRIKRPREAELVGNGYEMVGYEMDSSYHSESGCMRSTSPEEKGNVSKATLRLPDLIELLAKEGQVLQWNSVAEVYEVINGPLFEERFNALRCVRGKRKEQAMDRPFARMHSHFVLVSGGRWGGTGSTFRPIGKGPPRPNRRDGDSHSPPVLSDTTSSPSSDHDPAYGACANVKPNTVSADMVTVALTTDPNSQSTLLCTLQQFLDITGAGELYQRAVEKKQSQNHCSAPMLFPNLPEVKQVNVAQVERPCQPAEAGGHQQGFDFSVPDGILSERDIANIVGTMWQEDSLGDQGYFFLREDGCSPFFNGAIVALVDGRLTSSVPRDERTMYMVVSDKNVKWKGEPIPTAEEEDLGHWCAFLGQVPVWVEGSVQCGDYIGPKDDGSGRGTVTTFGKGPVIGIALMSKDTVGAAVVKTLCFAGFNALSPLGSEFKKLFLQTHRLEASVDDLRRNVHECEECILSVLAGVEERDAQLRTLQNRIETVEAQTSDSLGAAVGSKKEDWSPAPRSLQGYERPMTLCGKASMWAERYLLCRRIIVVLTLVIFFLLVRGWLWRGDGKLSKQSELPKPFPSYGQGSVAAAAASTMPGWMLNVTDFWPNPQEFADWMQEERAEHERGEENEGHGHQGSGSGHNGRLNDEKNP